jgi:DNA-binding transcriptional regulator WhiA
MQTINAFGKQITIKPLTIGDTLEIETVDNPIEKSLYIIAKATGLSVDEIKNADIKYVKDIEKITKIIMPEDTEDPKKK